jgi:hypothetical protein
MEGGTARRLGSRRLPGLAAPHRLILRMEQKFLRRVKLVRSGEIEPMQAIAIDRVMRTYGMIVNLTADEERAAREKVTSHLAGKSAADENALAVEGLRYLRSVREIAIKE